MRSFAFSLIVLLAACHGGDDSSSAPCTGSACGGNGPGDDHPSAPASSGPVQVTPKLVLARGGRVRIFAEARVAPDLADAGAPADDAARLRASIGDLVRVFETVAHASVKVVTDDSTPAADELAVYV